MSDKCEICGDELFMVPSGDLTCIKRCRFVEPTTEQAQRLYPNRVRRIKYQLREFTQAAREWRDDFEPNPRRAADEER